MSKTPTQNDWKKRLEKLILSKALIAPAKPVKMAFKYMFDFVGKELADARKEVIEKVETQRDILEGAMKKDELRSGYYLSGVERMAKAILATLREESK